MDFNLITLLDRNFMIKWINNVLHNMVTVFFELILRNVMTMYILWSYGVHDWLAWKMQIIEVLKLIKLRWLCIFAEFV